MSSQLQEDYCKLALVNIEVLDPGICRDRFKRFLTGFVLWLRSFQYPFKKLIKEKKFVLSCLEIINKVLSMRVLVPDSSTQFAAIQNIFKFFSYVSANEEFHSNVFQIMLRVVSNIRFYYSINEASDWPKIIIRYLSKENVTNYLHHLYNYIREGEQQQIAFWWNILCFHIFPIIKDVRPIAFDAIELIVEVYPICNFDIFEKTSLISMMKLFYVIEFTDKIYLIDKVLQLLFPSEEKSVISATAEHFFPSPFYTSHYIISFSSEALSHFKSLNEHLLKTNLLSQFIRTFLSICIYMLNTHDENLIRNAFLRLCAIWKICIDKETDPKIIHYILCDLYSTSDANVTIFICFVQLFLLFDLACYDEYAWEFFSMQLQLDDKLMINILENYITIVTVALSPLFLHFQTEKSKRLEFIKDFFEKPIILADQIIHLSLVKENGYYFFPLISICHFTEEKAIYFLSNILTLIDFDNSPGIILSFVKTVITIEKMFPKSYPIDNYFLPKFILFDIDENGNFINKLNIRATNDIVFNDLQQSWDHFEMWKDIFSICSQSFTKPQKHIWYSMLIWALKKKNDAKTLLFIADNITSMDDEFSSVIPFVIDSLHRKPNFGNSENVFKIADMLISLLSMTLCIKTAKDVDIIDDYLKKWNCPINKDLFSRRVEIVNLYYELLSANSNSSFLFSHISLFMIIVFSGDSILHNSIQFTYLFRHFKTVLPAEISAMTILFIDRNRTLNVFPHFPQKLLASVFETLEDQSICADRYELLTSFVFDILICYPDLLSARVINSICNENAKMISKDKYAKLLLNANEFFQTLNYENGIFPITNLNCNESLVVLNNKDSLSTVEKNGDFVIAIKQATSIKKFFVNPEESHEISSENREKNLDFDDIPIEEEDETDDFLSADKTNYNVVFQDIPIFDADHFLFKNTERKSYSFTFDTKEKQKSKSMINISPEIPDDKFSQIRQLYSLLLQKNSYDFLEQNEPLNRQISRISSIPHKNVSKIGVIYVKNDQTEQNSILRNTIHEASPHFHRFLDSIGDVVDLKLHKGYDGKLDLSRFSNGRHSIFFYSIRNEIMFHVAPMMPTVENDDQQLLKKRHVGNDNVQIIWSDNISHEYDTQTITSQFNDAHLVVYPIGDGLFRVDIKKKTENYFFGPLTGKHILPSEPLAFLVKWTAVMADIQVRKNYEKEKISENFFTLALSEITPGGRTNVKVQSITIPTITYSYKSNIRPVE